MKIRNRNNKKEVQPNELLQLKMDCIRKDLVLSDVLLFLTTPSNYYGYLKILSEVTKEVRGK